MLLQGLADAHILLGACSCGGWGVGFIVWDFGAWLMMVRLGLRKVG